MPLVLTHKPSSGYDDVPEERYHFPATYRRLVERSAGEWFVYYEPRRGGGREVYVAMARLGQVWRDPRHPGQFYVGVSEYQGFTQAVPWTKHGRTIEASLQKADGSTNKGQFGRSVRELPLTEFETIVRRGLAAALGEDVLTVPSAAEGDPLIIARELVSVAVQRKVRDRSFMLNVRGAYAQTCAFTGLRVVNGGAWTEMEAAHIRPVEHDGPDSVRNGLALSRTMHALFDRGFLSVSDDYQILESRKAPLPEQLKAMLAADRRVRVPTEPNLQPHRAFLEFHRTHVFKDRAA